MKHNLSHRRNLTCHFCSYNFRRSNQENPLFILCLSAESFEIISLPLILCLLVLFFSRISANRRSALIVVFTPLFCFYRSLPQFIAFIIFVFRGLFVFFSLFCFSLDGDYTRWWRMEKWPLKWRSDRHFVYIRPLKWKSDRHYVYIRPLKWRSDRHYVFIRLLKYWYGKVWY